MHHLARQFGRAASLAIAFGALALCGCSAKQDQQRTVVSTGPLELDPTEKFSVEGWWSNGSILLLLQDDASYTLWNGTDRYHRPDEVGRWNRDNYFEMWLEPYHVRKVERRRIEIRKVSGLIALVPPGQAPMMWSEIPPQAPEDSLFGNWEANGSTLRLFNSMRYEFISPPAGGAPVAVTRHQGRWSLEGSSLTIEPESPVIPLRSFEIRYDGANPVSMESQGEYFSRRSG